MDKSALQQQLVKFIDERLVWPVSPALQMPGQSALVRVGLQHPGGDPVWFSDAQALGNALAAEVGFQALRLGTWLNTPDGDLIASATGQLLPPQYRPEYQFVVDALQFAASKQRTAGWQRALGVGVIATAFGLAIRFWPSE
jgi:hypothetical protein